MYFNREKLDSLNYYYLLIIIVVISFMLRMYFRSNYLDDWDSVQFIMGLKDYSIVNHQPHPPGYPVYIFLGRVTDYFFNNGLASFTFMSALFGSLALIPTYLLAKDFFGFRVGILSAIILSLAPAEMLFSEVVMSDIVSMFFIATTVCLLYKGLNSTRYLYVGSFILGITIGVRQTDILLLLVFTIIIIYKASLKSFIISLVILLFGISIWLVPVILDTGLSTFIYMISTQGKAAADMGTLNSLGGVSLSNMIITVKTLALLLVSAWSPAIIPFGLLAVGLIFYKIKNFKNVSGCNQLIILLAWLTPYFILFIFITSLYISRYLLPVFPSLAIIFSYSAIRVFDVIRIKPLKPILVLIIIISIAFMGHQAISSSYQLHTTKPAPVIAADFIADHYSSNNTIIFATESFRHFQYYLPNFLVKNYPFISQNEIKDFLIKNKTIVSEYDPIIVNDYNISRFNRNSRIYPKHEQVILTENKLSCGEYAIVLDRVGWHGLENWGGVSTRWIEDSANMYIYSTNNSSAFLDFTAISFFHNRTLQVSSGNDFEARMVIPTNLVCVTVPIHLINGANIVKMNVLEGCERPRDKPELNSLDSRCLSVAVQLMAIRAKNFSVPDYSSGFYDLENWSGSPSRWMESNATLVVYSSENRTANLSLQTLSFYQPRNLQVYSGDEFEARIAVPTSFINICTPIHLAKGANTLHLCVPEGCDRPVDKPELNNPDSRCLCLAIQNLFVT